MTPKLRKVQAQRKFAQGAFIPPQNNNIERPTEAQEKPAPAPPVIQNMSAGELLDKISFNNIHNHEPRMQPIVRLERLARIQQVRPRFRPPSIVQSLKSLILPIRFLPRNRGKNRVLRKRVTVKENTKIVKKKKRINTRYTAKRKTCKEDTDTEDDTPLKFLVKKTPKTGLPSTSAAAPATNGVRSPVLKAPGNATTSPGAKSNNKNPANQSEWQPGAKAPGFEGFYSPGNIERWISAGAETTNQFKVPLPPREGKRFKPNPKSKEKQNSQDPQTNDRTLRSYENAMVLIDDVVPLSTPAESAIFNPGMTVSDIVAIEGRVSPAPSCPSERYVTVKDVVSASDKERAERCKVCNFCSRAEKVEMLSKVVQATASGRDSDVYEFDIDREVVDPSLRGFRSRRRPADSFVYLDILPSPSTHVIQIKLTRVLNQKKPMMQARLMPKNAASSLSEYNLVEHEGLFEQLIETLDSRLLKRLKVAKPPGRQKAGSSKAAESAPVAGTSKDNTKTAPAKPSNESKKVRGRPKVGRKTRAAGKALNTPKKSRAGPVKGQENGVVKKGATTSVSPALPRASVAPSAPAAPAAPAAPTVPAAEPGPSSQPDQTASQGLKSPQHNRDKPTAVVREAPVYYPTEAEFNDPVAYFEKIMPTASKFGLCKVVAPASFKPKCTINDKIRFHVANQYIARLYTRWGPACKEMSAIKAHLASQSVPFTRPPILDSLEVDLPKLYRTVQRLGGLNTVIEKKLWARVAEQMRFAKRPQLVKKLDDIYVKYLLPYDTLSSQEREDIKALVSKSWHKKNERILQRMANPLHRQKQLLGEGGSSTSDTEDEANIACALSEAEDCIVSGPRMTLANFTKVAQAVKEQYFPETPEPSPRDVEEEYWRIVLLAAEHLCVHTASIDTGEEGYGFPKSKQDPHGKHPWNPKMISQNPGNVLAMLGPVLGVTVPTLHLGMIFSTSCWHRDPHGLPWLEYMHSGPAKIWYGIPDDQSAAFRSAVERLCPTSCQNKSIWLPSDITMVPPHFLLSSNVSLTRVEQRPGEYIIVFPKAYSSSISTGYTQSESVYFATNSWLKNVDHVFHELRDSCEPTMFSLEQLLISVAGDPRAPASLLQLVHTTLATIVDDELQNRAELALLGVETIAAPPRKKPAAEWSDECEVCRATLYLSKVTGMIDRTSSVCLKHALRLLTSKKTKRDVTGLSLVLFFTKEQLEEVMSTLQSGICPNPL